MSLDKEKAMDSFRENLKDLLSNGADICGRKYTFAPMPFKVAKKINAFYTVVAGDISIGSLAFSDTPKFENEIEPLLIKYTLCDEFKLDTMDDHFDKFKGDWNEFVVKSILGHAAPFLLGSVTSSASTPQENQTRTLRKPM